MFLDGGPDSDVREDLAMCVPLPPAARESFRTIVSRSTQTELPYGELSRRLAVRFGWVEPGPEPPACSNEASAKAAQNQGNQKSRPTAILLLCFTSARRKKGKKQVRMLTDWRSGAQRALAPRRGEMEGRKGGNP